ncbi:MAG: hypothetical protein ACKV0T_21470, partial [Planctomycetales bacterium]
MPGDPASPAAASVEESSRRESPEYCCLGCQMAARVTRDQGATGAARWTLIRLGVSLFLTLNTLAFSMALWTRDVYPAGTPSTFPTAPLEG